MASFSVNLSVVKHHREILFVPNMLLKKLALEDRQIIPIFFGLHHSRRVLVRSIKSKKNHIYLSSKLKKTLRIPYTKKIIVKNEELGLRLGPLLGILTTDYTGRKFTNLNNNNPFGAFFKNLLSPEPLYPVYYFVFTPENVNWSSNTIDGYFYTSKNTWEIITVPFPDVIYNRIPNRSIEKKGYIERFKNEYLLKGGKMFNSNFFNKWDIYNILVANDQTKNFIPETYLNPSLTKFSEMIDKYPIVYLKPANGSLGLGIYKVMKGINNKYVVQYRNKKTNRSIIYKEPIKIYKHIFSNKYRQRYIIQQGIDLIEYQNSPVDFRIQLHKDHLNQWQVPAIGAKVAGKGSVTTHLRTGGRLINAESFLTSIYGNQTHSLLADINQSAIQIAKTVEDSMNQPIGELGLDIGIDKKRRIWLFEVNSKPGRSIFKHPSLKKARSESNKRLIEYATFLSGMNTN